ncbi:MAG: hypothetical protein ABEH35_07450 [Haloarculaceae archaeon]
MTGRYGDIDYPQLTKRAFAVGLALFLVGTVGGFLVRAGGLSVPAWEETLLLDAEIVGVVLMLLSPIVFGIILPLTE